MEKSLKEMCKDARKALGLTQKEFAELIGTTQTEISFIEGGFTPVNEEKAIAIMEIYDAAIAGESKVTRREGFLKKAGKEVMFALGFGGEARTESVDDGLLDFSGQGRNKYGK